jgi:hypothetical protein
MSETHESDAKAHLSDMILEVIDAVDMATEDPTRERVAAALAKLASVEKLYASLLGSHKDEMEERFGRRMLDLKRQASRLPAQRSSGSMATLANDAGVIPFIENRATQSRTTPREHADKGMVQKGNRIGGEVEAWCGPCAGLTTHHIVAMVGDQPKQVICQSCRARHGFRLSPARGKAVAAEATQRAPEKRRKTREEQDAERRQAERKALREELQNAATVRPWDPKERYKPGEILAHPEHGRGKVENVLRRSMLVRFEDGLKPVDLS